MINFVLPIKKGNYEQKSTDIIFGHTCFVVT